VVDGRWLVSIGAGDLWKRLSVITESRGPRHGIDVPYAVAGFRSPAWAWWVIPKFDMKVDAKRYFKLRNHFGVLGSKLQGRHRNR
jgi:hypothetical protein